MWSVSWGELVAGMMRWVLVKYESACVCAFLQSFLEALFFNYCLCAYVCFGVCMCVHVCVCVRVCTCMLA